MVALLLDNPLLLLFAVAAVGYVIGRIRVRGFGLGVAAVLFVGLAFGALDPEMRLPEIVTELGLVLFVYCVGLTSGPGFVQALGRRGLRANLLIAGAVLGAAGLIAACRRRPGPVGGDRRGAVRGCADQHPGAGRRRRCDRRVPRPGRGVLGRLPGRCRRRARRDLPHPALVEGRLPHRDGRVGGDRRRPSGRPDRRGRPATCPPTCRWSPTPRTTAGRSRSGGSVTTARCPWSRRTPGSPPGTSSTWSAPPARCRPPWTASAPGRPPISSSTAASWTSAACSCRPRGSPVVPSTSSTSHTTARRSHGSGAGTPTWWPRRTPCSSSVTVCGSWRPATGCPAWPSCSGTPTGPCPSST